MKNIVWLASYPKSGNTWTRTFISNLKNEKEEPSSIRALGVGKIASARNIFDDYAGIEASDLLPREIQDLRPEVYDAYSDDQIEIQYMKIHDALGVTSTGRIDVSEYATRKAVYIVRNPLDVCVSFAHHNNDTVENTVKNLNDSEYAFCKAKNTIPMQLRQDLRSWSLHVKSWLETKAFPVHLMRYEDMVTHPHKTFQEMAAFAELPCDNENIARAVKFSSFDELKKQEEKEGFYEKNHNSKSPFFRKGKVGSWREELSEELAELLIKEHAEVMHQLGYLTADNKPVY